MFMGHGNIAILKLKSADYYCFISGISKKETITLMQNVDLTEKSQTLKGIKIHCLT